MYLLLGRPARRAQIVPECALLLPRLLALLMRKPDANWRSLKRASSRPQQTRGWTGVVQIDTIDCGRQTVGPGRVGDMMSKYIKSTWQCWAGWRDGLKDQKWACFQRITLHVVIVRRASRPRRLSEPPRLNISLFDRAGHLLKAGMKAI